MIELNVPYRSAYTMEANGELSLVEDTLVFTVEDDAIIGTGTVDSDGLTMHLRTTPNGDYLVGSWEELNPEGEVAYGGVVTFLTEPREQPIGYWSMQVEDGESFGRWDLSLIDQAPPAHPTVPYSFQFERRGLPAEARDL